MLKIMFLFLLCFNYSQILSQGSFCPFDESPPQGKTASGQYGYLPDKDTLKTLIIFVKIKDFNYDDGARAWDRNWPEDLGTTLPSWCDSIISSSVQSSYDNPSVSGYFHEMSNEEYHVIGDVYDSVYITDKTHTQYESGGGVAELTEEVLVNLDSEIDYGDYTNGNDYVDMIMIFFRASTIKDLDINYSKSYDGYASLTGGTNNFYVANDNILTLDGVTIEGGARGSGIICNYLWDIDKVGLIAHEIGHYFGWGHYTYRKWGLMDGYNSSGLMSPLERHRLGWGTLTTLSSGNNTIKEWPHDEIYRIYSSSIGKYYYVENYNGNSYYDSDWNYMSGELHTPGNGILIYTGSGPGIISDIESAEGNFDWKKDGADYIEPFEEDDPNPTSGIDELMIVTTTQEHPDFTGDQEDCFTLDYNKVFSPYSNPRAVGMSIELKQQYSNGDYQIYIDTSSPYDVTPAKPYVYPIEEDNGSPKITWYDFGETDINAFWVFRSTSYSGTYSYVTSANCSTFTYTDTGAPDAPSTGYLYYIIKSFDNTYKVSNSSEIRKLDVVPSVPGNYQLTEDVRSPTLSKPKLTWNVNTEADIAGYNIYRKLDGESSFSVIETLSSTTSSYIDMEVNIRNFGNNKTAYYYVEVFDDDTEDVSLTNVTVTKSIDYGIEFDRGDDQNLVKINEIPKEYGLSGNYPNPFNPTTRIKFALPETGKVKITIYNIQGKVISSIANREYPAGYHEVSFDASNLSSSFYFYKIEVNGYVSVKKMQVIK